MGWCPRLLAPLRCGIDRGNVPHTFILAEAALLAVVFRPSKREKCGPQRCSLGPGGSECRTVDVVSRPEATGGLYHKENEMNEDVFNGSIRKFLKTLGVSAQRDIEKAVRRALAEGKLKGNEKFPATGTITLGGIGLSHEIKGEIELE